jgi:8-oxo-dGTP diphosphatase
VVRAPASHAGGHWFKSNTAHHSFRLELSPFSYIYVSADIYFNGVITLKEIHSVTCFLESENEILILLRSEKVRTYQGFWGGVSGRIQDDRTPLEQARLEVEEETGLGKEEIVLVKEGKALIFDDNEVGIRKVVYPFLFHIDNRNKVRIDWEHNQCKWIRSSEIGQYKTMPQLKETLLRVTG